MRTELLFSKFYFIFICASSVLVMTAMLTHTFAASFLTVSISVSIPKGNHANLNDSANNRSITLSSVTCNLVDLIAVNRDIMNGIHRLYISWALNRKDQFPFLQC